MPKIIENLREELLAEAKRQIAERGYKNTTIRSVAAECGIAVGTVYNYFPSKEMLVAAFMYEDWQAQLDAMEDVPADALEKQLQEAQAARSLPWPLPEPRAFCSQRT